MIARLSQLPDGSWLIACDEHQWERHAPTFKPAERIAREHNNSKHKEAR